MCFRFLVLQSSNKTNQTSKDLIQHLEEEELRGNPQISITGDCRSLHQTMCWHAS